MQFIRSDKYNLMRYIDVFPI